MTMGQIDEHVKNVRSAALRRDKFFLDYLTAMNKN
jgi:hypothetical protein